jgi:hypothetical protein
MENHGSIPYICSGTAIGSKEGRRMTHRRQFTAFDNAECPSSQVVSRVAELERLLGRVMLENDSLKKA